MEGGSPLSWKIREALLKSEYVFHLGQIGYGLSFRFTDGAILNVYQTGKVTWQGRATSTRGQVEPLIEQARHAIGPTALRRTRASRAGRATASPRPETPQSIGDPVPWSYADYAQLGEGDWVRDP